MKILRLLADGFDSILSGLATLTIDPAPLQVPKLRRRTNGFEEDRRALASDWEKVGGDLRISLDRTKEALGETRRAGDGSASERSVGKGDLGGVS